VCYRDYRENPIRDALSMISGKPIMKFTHVRQAVLQVRAFRFSINALYRPVVAVPGTFIENCIFFDPENQAL
jgi:hypothetical protein